MRSIFNNRSWVRSIIPIAFAFNCVPAQSQTTVESKEVVYSTVDAAALKKKAGELKTAVAIYEYVRNTTEYVPYWGSMSGSVNTFLGRTGNNVDQASLLIAMLRSQGIPARYVEGPVFVLQSLVDNWLGNSDTVDILNEGSGAYVSYEMDGNAYYIYDHVWVEAMVPLDKYRGVALDSVVIDCVASPDRCGWVSLDPSFKQKKYNGISINPTIDLGWNKADYTAYYDATKNKDVSRKDNSPLVIFEQEVVEWLRSTPAHKGRSVEDVIDGGQIIPVREGLLPSSLPYRRYGAKKTYDTMEQHDSISTQKWDRSVTVSVTPCRPDTYAGAVTPRTFSLSQIATDRLWLYYSAGAGGTINIDLHQGRDPLKAPVMTWNFGSVACQEGLKTFAVGTPFYIKLAIDGTPRYYALAPAIYQSVVGGRSLLAVGGEFSNWSQVHRAADSLLAANQTYKVANSGCDINGANCTAYLDSNGNGTVDSGEVKLVDSPAALNALTSGFLEVASAQYLAKMREQFKRVDGLLRRKTALHSLLGVVQSGYAVQYLKDGTAFSIQPDGLVIDMRGSQSSQSRGIGPYMQQPFPAYDALPFFVHIGSALEHETWQALTGFDAISTVRTFQIGRASGSTLKTYRRNATVNDAALLRADLAAQPIKYSAAKISEFAALLESIPAGITSRELTLTLTPTALPDSNMVSDSYMLADADDTGKTTSVTMAISPRAK